MHIPRFAHFLSSVCLGVLVVTGCQPSNTTAAPNEQPSAEQKVSIMSPQVSIKVGELGPEYLKRYPDLIRTYQSLPGVVQDYDIHWRKRPHGIVKIEHGKHSFVIEDVLSIQTDQALTGEFAAEGLAEFDISAGITEPDLISHDEARLKTYAILHRIVQAGWKPIVSRSDPRINGKSRLDYVLSVDDTIGLDPYYTPSLAEWMNIESRTDWMFYADHQYLTVSFTRERTLTDPTKPGSYLLNFNIKSELEEFRAYVGPDNRQRWKELLPGELAKLLPIREKREAALRAKGIKIDETYEDPPVPDVK